MEQLILELSIAHVFDLATLAAAALSCKRLSPHAAKQIRVVISNASFVEGAVKLESFYGTCPWPLSLDKRSAALNSFVTLGMELSPSLRAKVDSVLPQLEGLPFAIVNVPPFDSLIFLLDWQPTTVQKAISYLIHSNGLGAACNGLGAVTKFWSEDLRTLVAILGRLKDAKGYLAQNEWNNIHKTIIATTEYNFELGDERIGFRVTYTPQ